MFISAVIAETGVREYILYLFSDFTEYVFTLFLYLFFFKLTCQKVVRKNLALTLVYSRNRHIDFKTRHFLHHSLTFIALTLLVGRQERTRPVKIVVICLERGAHCLHMVQS